MKAKLIEDFTYLKPKKLEKAQFKNIIDDIEDALYRRDMCMLKDLELPLLTNDEKNKIPFSILNIAKKYGFDPKNTIVMTVLDQKYSAIYNFLKAVYYDIDGGLNLYQKQFGQVYYNIDEEQRVVRWLYSWVDGWMVDYPTLKEKMQKMINEGFTYLKPKTEKEINDALERTFEEIADILVEDYGEFNDFVEAYEYVSNHRDRILELIEGEETTLNIAEFLINGAWSDESDNLKFGEDYELDEGFTYLKPKTKEEINAATEELILKVADDMFKEYPELFHEYIEAHNFAEQYRKKISGWSIYTSFGIAEILVQRYHPEFKHFNTQDSKWTNPYKEF